jgi:hypothetical protein
MLLIQKWKNFMNFGKQVNFDKMNFDDLGLTAS